MLNTLTFEERDEIVASFLADADEIVPPGTRGTGNLRLMVDHIADNLRYHLLDGADPDRAVKRAYLELGGIVDARMH